MEHAEKIFGNRFSDESYLQEIVEEYPYFSYAHLQLLKLTATNDRSYPGRLAMTAAHFNNPFLLQYRLQNIPDVKLEEIKQPSAPIQAEHNKPDVTLEEAPLFEPLYTSDYFASQGIRLSDEIKSDDKLGRQLKSFTDWLKTMKKVHPVKNENIPLDVTVEKLAERSNREEDVLTESMAEVYESQGKYQKAREVYEKLSLLNPAKSAFFAAKLEKIKEK